MYLGGVTTAVMYYESPTFNSYENDVLVKIYHYNPTSIFLNQTFLFGPRPKKAFWKQFETISTYTKEVVLVSW